MPNFVGKNIGRYHLVEQLGIGGMATVYKAIDTHLERQVAIKVIRRDAFPTEQVDRVLKRFDREAKTLAQLTHTNIVGIIDYGDFEGWPYLVMEYLSGGTLKQRLGKPVQYHAALQLMLPVAQALAFAHQKGVVHRDVKPANILITEGGQPMLTDFGIAKILGDDGDATLTGAGVGVGTPEYMAPEQGMGHKIDGRADLYSLGIVLYELITGRKPFTADTPMAVILKHVTDPLPRPKLFVPDLPDQVERVLFKALAKKPEDRYKSMGEFIAAVERLIADIGSASTKPAEFQIKPEYFAADDTETDEITRDLVEGAQSATPEPDPSAPPEDISLPGRTPDSGVSTIDDNVQPSPDETPRQTRRRVKPWQGLALVAVLVIAAIGIIFLTKPSPGAVPGTITPVIPTATTSPVSPTLQPSMEVTATIESTAAPMPFGAEIMHLGDGRLFQIAFSPDGKTLAAATSFGIQLYDTNTLEKNRYIYHGSAVTTIAFSPDGQTMASGSDETIRLWDARSGKLLKTLGGHANFVSSVAFSPDGQILASGSGDRTIKLWDAASGRLLNTLRAHLDEVISVAFSPDGSLLASGSWDKTIRVWDTESGALLQTLKGHTSSVFSVAFSLDSQVLASGSGDTITLWNVASGELLQTLKGRAGKVNGIGFSKDGSIMAAGMCYGTIRVWDAANWQSFNTLTNPDTFPGDCVDSIAFSPNGHTLASRSTDNIIRLWDATNGKLLRTLEMRISSIYSVVYSPDGQTLATGYRDSTIRLWDVTSGQLLKTLEGHTSYVDSVAFSPDGQILASGSGDKTIKIWDANSGQLLRTLVGLTNSITSVAFSLDGQTLASGCSGDNTIRLWDVANGQLLKTIVGHTKSVLNIAYSPDGQTLASGSADKTIRLWDTESGALLKTLKGHTEYVISVAFSPSGLYLASGSWDKTIQLWDVPSGKLLQTLKGHTEDVKSVAFSPDGSLLVSGSREGTIKLWDAESGLLLRTLQGHTGEVNSVAFSPDGSTLASGSEDGTIRIWNMANR